MLYNTAVETFRDEEYPMMKGKIYLDHSGTTIYAKSLVDQFSSKLIANLYGNPHSESDPAKLSSQVIEETREAALRFFGADPEHFDLIFTANATAAIKLVAESFLDLAHSGSSTGTFFYGYHRDAHTSLVGIRELAKGTHHCFTSDEEVEQWLIGDNGKSNVPNFGGVPGLFAYPGQSNMTGRRLPLSWARQLRQSNKMHHQNTYSLLDAAALAMTSQLDFSDPDVAPDFTALSFYKIFGFPDLGALIVRKKSGHILSWRRYFGGGTVDMVTVIHESTVQRRSDSLHSALEDGTLPFHNIMALDCALEVHKKLYGSMSTISQHTTFLAKRLYDGLCGLQHWNGSPVCNIYNDARVVQYGNPTLQGATIAFSVLRPNGSHIGHARVEKLANDEGIFVRSGGLCNSGGITHYLQIEPWQYKRNWSAGFRCGADESQEIINGKPTGVVRVSIGAMSTLEDIDSFLDFMAATFESKPEISASHFVTSQFEHGVSRTTEKIEVDSECALVRHDSGFHSRCTDTNVSCSPVKLPMLRTAVSIPNFRPTEKPLPPVIPRSSEESIRLQKARRRAARLVLPDSFEQTDEVQHEKQVRQPLQMLPNGNNSLRVPHYHEPVSFALPEIEPFKEPHDTERKASSLRLKFWKGRKLVSEVAGLRMS